MRRSHLVACVPVLALLSAAPASVGRAAARPRYTLAFKSFAPERMDVFIAGRDGSGPRALAADGGLNYNASFSPDGRWVLFTSHRAGSADIYRVRPNGSGLQRLTRSPAFDDQGALSPDGRTLAFVSSRAGQADIWTLDLATRALRNVTRSSGGDFRPAWSPDGRWIAFSSDRNPARRSCPRTTAPGPASFTTPQYTSIYLVRPDGSGLRRLTGAGEVTGTPGWSADGRRLAFYTADPREVCSGGLRFGQGVSEIAVLDVATGARQTVTTGAGVKGSPRWVGADTIAYQMGDGIHVSGGATIPGRFQAPAWSPDGRAMVFHRAVPPATERGARVREWPSPDARFRLVHVPELASYAPAGDRMAYFRTNLTGPIRNGALVVTNADGSAPRAIFVGALTDDVAGPAWSPRGDRILFGVGGFFQRAGIKPARLMSIHPDGTGLVPAVNDTLNDGMPSWSPDASQVVYRVAGATTRQLYILDVATGTRHRLDTGSTYDTFPTWSPRGDWIAFTSKRDGDYEIYRIHPDGSGLQRLTRSPGNDAHAAFSPDGQWIAFATGRQGFKDEALSLLISPSFQPYGEVAVMRADGTGLRVLTDNAMEEGAPAWVPAPAAR